MASKPTRTWGPYDTALWHTCAVLGAIRADRLDALPELAVPFALQLGGHGERVFGSGQMALSTWDSPGDGSYYHSGGFLMATGKGGLALTAGVAGVQAIRNASRRRQAAAAAQLLTVSLDAADAATGMPTSGMGWSARRRRMIGQERHDELAPTRPAWSDCRPRHYGR